MAGLRQRLVAVGDGEEHLEEALGALGEPHAAVGAVSVGGVEGVGVLVDAAPRCLRAQQDVHLLHGARLSTIQKMD